MISDKFRHNIEETNYVNKRIIRIVINMGKERIHFIGVYAPDETKSKKEIETFYNDLECEMNKVLDAEELLIMGNLNAKVSNTVMNGVMQRFNEPHINDSGEKLIDFCAHHELRINNTFFDHKPQHKTTWANTRGQSSTIDFIISNRTIHPSRILDIRSLPSANIESDHHLLLGKIRVIAQMKRKPKPLIVEKLKNF